MCLKVGLHIHESKTSKICSQPLSRGASSSVGDLKGRVDKIMGHLGKSLLEVAGSLSVGSTMFPLRGNHNQTIKFDKATGSLRDSAYIFTATQKP